MKEPIKVLKVLGSGQHVCLFVWGLSPSYMAEILPIRRKTFNQSMIGVYHPTREFFTHIWKYLWRAANFDLCAALMAIEQWGFFRLPYLLWHGTSNYNGHLREPLTLTAIAERLVVELSLPVFTTAVYLEHVSEH